ncbi:MAG TPA: hypothetical protein PLR90_03525 [Methylophilus sp.]|nr:hypothetical protein [Methylophilus sp.]HQQ32966.1 hypothetical protein [Methylophilus sp.]
MLIYQVLDEQNYPIGEYSDLDYALHRAEDLTLWHAEHYYHVQELMLEDAELEDAY